MAKLKNFLADYFLGTEIMRDERNRRSIYKEFITNPKELKGLLNCSRRAEKVGIAFGKYLPSVLDIGSLVISVVTKNPAYLVAIPISEAGRFVMHKIMKDDEIEELCCKVLKSMNSAETAVDDLVEKIQQDEDGDIDTSGYDGWLNPK